MMSSNRWMFFSLVITVSGLAVFGTIEVGKGCQRLKD